MECELMLQSNVLHLCQHEMTFGLMTTCVINPWCWQLLLLTVAWFDGALEHHIEMFCGSVEQDVVSKMLHRQRFFCVLCLWLVDWFSPHHSCLG